MEEEEHEVYGGEIPVEGEMEGDVDSHQADVDMSTADDDAVKVSLSRSRCLRGFVVVCVVRSSEDAIGAGFLFWVFFFLLMVERRRSWMR